MTHKLIIAALVLLGIGPGCLAQQGQPSITTMGNGLTVILQEDHSAQLVAIDVWVKAGSANETPKNNGVSHFIEHMCFGATTKRQAGAADLEMESLGATLDAHTSKDWAHFNTTVSSRYLSKALDVLGDAVTGAQFKEEDVQKERNVLLEEIAKKSTDPLKQCKDYVAAQIYGTHPYALPVEGSPQTIRSITRDDILDYYHRYYVPKNIAVVLVGDFDMQRAVSMVGQAFQGLSTSPMPVAPVAEVAPIPKQVNKTVDAPFKLDYITIGFLGPKGSDVKDVCATDLLLTYLGGGYQSWIDQELKQKMGLSAEGGTAFLTQKQQALVSLVASSTQGNITKVKGALFAKIASLRTDGIAEANLAISKRSLLGEYAFQSETFSGRANSLGFYYTVSEPRFAVDYVNCVQSLTNEDIIRVASKYLDPARAVVLVVGPQEGGAQ